MTEARNPFVGGVRYLRAESVMQRFGISRWTLRRWLQDSKIGFPKPILVGPRHFYSEPEILRWEMRQAGLDPDAVPEAEGYRTCSPVLTDYGGLVQALTKRRERLGISTMELDAVSGMQEGYTSKLENYRKSYGRGMGPDTMPLWLGGLRVGIVLVELPRATRNFRSKAESPISGG